MQSINVCDLICWVKTIVLHSTNLRRMMWRLNVDKEVPSELVADVDRIKQILLNLTENAVIYSCNASRVQINASYEKETSMLQFVVQNKSVPLSSD